MEWADELLSKQLDEGVDGCYPLGYDEYLCTCGVKNDLKLISTRVWNKK